MRPSLSEQSRRDGAPPILLVLPGSRRSEIGHHMAVFGETLGKLQAQGLAFEAVLPTMPHLESAIARGLENWPVRPRVVVGESAGKTIYRLQAEVRDEAQARAICGGLKVAKKACVPVLPH